MYTDADMDMETWSPSFSGDYSDDRVLLLKSEAIFKSRNE